MFLDQKTPVHWTHQKNHEKSKTEMINILIIEVWGIEISNHQVRALEGEGADSELLFFLQAPLVQVTEVIQAVQVAQVKAVDPGVR